MQYKILWIDQRDKNGIATDESGNEYYIFSDLNTLGYVPGGTKIDAVAFSCSIHKASAVVCLKEIALTVRS